jgi:hypothetical protein
MSQISFTFFILITIIYFKMSAVELMVLGIDAVRQSMISNRLSNKRNNKQALMEVEKHVLCQ